MAEALNNTTTVATRTFTGSRFMKPGKWYTENASNLEFLAAHEVAEQEGRLHRPELHSKVLTSFREVAEARGLQLTDECGQLSQNGKNFIYTARIASGDADYSYTIGFRNYNDRTLAFHGMFGSHVFVCTNGMCTDYIIPSRTKHIHNDFTPMLEKINIIFDCFPQEKNAIDNGILQLKNTPVDDNLVGKFLVTGLRENIFCPKVSGMVLKEYDKPTLNSNDDTSLWRLANAVSYVTTHCMTGELSHREQITRWSWNCLCQMATNA